jgi:hypothetical protein
LKNSKESKCYHDVVRYGGLIYDFSSILIEFNHILIDQSRKNCNPKINSIYDWEPDVFRWNIVSIVFIMNISDFIDGIVKIFIQDKGEGIIFYMILEKFSTVENGEHVKTSILKEMGFGNDNRIKTYKKILKNNEAIVDKLKSKMVNLKKQAIKVVEEKFFN